MSRSTKTSAQAAEEEKLRCGVAQAVTWEDFGKALKKFRGKKLSLRALEGHLHRCHTSIWEREQGMQKFEEDELRAYLSACNADDELITFCLHHYRRIAESLPQQAASEASSRNEISGQFEDSCKSLSCNDAGFRGFVVPFQPPRRNRSKSILAMIGVCTVVLMLMSITPKLYFTMKLWIAGWTTTVSGYGSSPSSCLTTADYDSVADEAVAYMRVCSGSAQVWRLTPAAHTEAKKSYNYYQVRNLINVDSGKCLDVTGAGLVVGRTCNNSLTQSWGIQIPVREARDVKEPVVASFYNLGSQACLAATSSGGYMGTPLTVAACPDESNQISRDYMDKKYWITDPLWPTWPSWIPWPHW